MKIKAFKGTLFALSLLAAFGTSQLALASCQRSDFPANLFEIPEAEKELIEYKTFLRKQVDIFGLDFNKWFENLYLSKISDVETYGHPLVKDEFKEQYRKLYKEHAKYLEYLPLMRRYADDHLDFAKEVQSVYSRYEAILKKNPGEEYIIEGIKHTFPEDVKKIAKKYEEKYSNLFIKKPGSGVTNEGIYLSFCSPNLNKLDYDLKQVRHYVSGAQFAEYGTVDVTSHFVAFNDPRFPLTIYVPLVLVDAKYLKALSTAIPESPFSFTYRLSRSERSLPIYLNKDEKLITVNYTESDTFGTLTCGNSIRMMNLFLAKSNSKWTCKPEYQSHHTKFRQLHAGEISLIDPTYTFLKIPDIADEIK
jgi:hypothetical protein